MEENRQIMELFILMYQVDHSSEYLTSAQEIGNNIWLNFADDDGLLSSSGYLAIAPNIVPRNNLDAVITFNKLYHLGDPNLNYKSIAKETYDNLDKLGLSKTTGNLPSLLKARYELANEPFHAVFITDPKKMDEAKPFFKEILKHSDDYVIFEYAILGSFTEEQELLYGGMDHGTLFMCTSTFCSAPIVEPIGFTWG